MDQVPDPKLGGLPLEVVSARDWKTRALDWIFAQGSIAIVLIAWLGWTIYNGQQLEKARIESSQRRMEWEEQLFKKIDQRLTDLAESFTKNLEKVITANERKTERDETRFDKIVDRIKGQ